MWVNLHRLAPSNFQVEEIIVMGQKYCPECREVLVTKAFANYSQVEYQDILVKR
jgi:hypothetical protein